MRLIKNGKNLKVAEALLRIFAVIVLFIPVCIGETLASIPFTKSFGNSILNKLVEMAIKFDETF